MPCAVLCCAVCHCCVPSLLFLCLVSSCLAWHSLRLALPALPCPTLPCLAKPNIRHTTLHLALPCPDLPCHAFAGPGRVPTCHRESVRHIDSTVHHTLRILSKVGGHPAGKTHAERERETAARKRENGQSRYSCPWPAAADCDAPPCLGDLRLSGIAQWVCRLDKVARLAARDCTLSYGFCWTDSASATDLCLCLCLCRCCCSGRVQI